MVISASTLVILLELVYFGGEDEVALGQAVDLVRPEGELDLAPGQVNIGMMVLLPGQFAHLVCEIKRLAEILE